MYMGFNLHPVKEADIFGKMMDYVNKGLYMCTRCNI